MRKATNPLFEFKISQAALAMIQDDDSILAVAKAGGRAFITVEKWIRTNKHRPEANHKMLTTIPIVKAIMKLTGLSENEIVEEVTVVQSVEFGKTQDAVPA